MARAACFAIVFLLLAGSIAYTQNTGDQFSTNGNSAAPPIQLGVEESQCPGADLRTQSRIDNADGNHDNIVSNIVANQREENVQHDLTLKRIGENNALPEEKQVEIADENDRHKNTLAELDRQMAFEARRHAEEIAEICAEGTKSAAVSPSGPAATPQAETSPQPESPATPGATDLAPVNEIPPGAPPLIPMTPIADVPLLPNTPAPVTPPAKPLTGSVETYVPLASPPLMLETPKMAPTPKPLLGHVGTYVPLRTPALVRRTPIMGPLFTPIPGAIATNAAAPPTQMYDPVPANFPPPQIPKGFYVAKAPNGGAYLRPILGCPPESGVDLAIAGLAAGAARAAAGACGGITADILAPKTGIPKLPPSEEMVWVNEQTQIIWRQGERWAGNTVKGHWDTLSNALKGGARLPKPNPTGQGW